MSQFLTESCLTFVPMPSFFFLLREAWGEGVPFPLHCMRLPFPTPAVIQKKQSWLSKKANFPQHSTKITDEQQYLHFHSDHLQHCKAASPRGVSIRPHRICFDDLNYSCKVNELCYTLSQRDYTESPPSEFHRRTPTFDRSEVLEPQGSTKYSNVPPNVRSILQKLKHLPHSTHWLKNIFSTHTVHTVTR